MIALVFKTSIHNTQLGLLSVCDIVELHLTCNDSSSGEAVDRIAPNYSYCYM